MERRCFRLPSLLDMRIIKYFFEEPTLLDFPASDSGDHPSEQGLKGLMRKHRHYRGYLAASDLGAGTIGGSALEDHAAARVLAGVLAGPIWFSNRASGQTEVALSLLTRTDDIVRALATMGSDAVMMMNVDPTEEMVRALTNDNDRKVGMRMIAQLLDAGCTLVFPEQAHMGHDWSVFSPRPIASEIRDKMGELPDDTRGFVIPYVEARGEHKFYFEQYNVDLFAKHEVR